MNWIGTREQANEALKRPALEKRVEEDSALRKELDRTIEQQREMLASDRDIRDLMGARELLSRMCTMLARTAKMGSRCTPLSHQRQVFDLLRLRPGQATGGNKCEFLPSLGRRGSFRNGL